MKSHPQPLSEFPPKKLPFPPHPPQQDSKRIIQIRELHPNPLLLLALVLHPHPVAVKSLIYSLQKFFVLCFIICTGLVCVSGIIKIFLILNFIMDIIF